MKLQHPVEDHRYKHTVYNYLELKHDSTPKTSLRVWKKGKVCW